MHQWPSTTAKTQIGNEELGVDEAWGILSADKDYEVFEVQFSVATAMEK
jgi:hypothetical protein